MTKHSKLSSESLLPEQATQFIPLTKLPEYIPYPPVATARWWVFRNYRGFSDKCTIKVGKRVLVSIQAINEWMKEQGEFNR